MTEKEEIVETVKSAYKKYSPVGDSYTNIAYVRDMVFIELLCDIRDLLHDIELNTNTPIITHK